MRSLRSSSPHQLSVPRHNLSFGSRPLPFSALRVWNSLPVSIRESHSLPTFRHNLKTFYFQSTYVSAAHLASHSDSSKTSALYKSCTYLLTYLRYWLTAYWTWCCCRILRVLLLLWSQEIVRSKVITNSDIWLYVTCNMCPLIDGIAGRRLSSVSLNSACSSILSHGTCTSMTTQVGSAVAKYGAYGRLGVADQGTMFGSLDRSAAWDSLGRHSTISGTVQQQRWENCLIVSALARVTQMYNAEKNISQK